MTPDLTLAELDGRLNALLPPRYQHCYERVRPDSMGSAGLRYDEAGRPAWDRIWTTFCDLALAGGPPHRGRWLPFPTPDELAADPSAQAAVAAEVARGIRLATLFPAEPDEAGRVTVELPTPEAAAWIRAAVVAENVAAGRDGCRLLVPAGPSFRVEKEVKNVVVAVAKTAHYWDGHLTEGQQRAAGELLDPVAPSVPPAEPDGLLTALCQVCNWPLVSSRDDGWVGVTCSDEAAAVWLLRAVVVSGVLVRREGHILYLPVSADATQTRRTTEAFAQAVRIWLTSDR